ncbi:hypothetical protein BJX96DRAFT_141464, partial [Aspergillus floccosus]
MASWEVVIGRVLLLSSWLQSWPPGPSGVVMPIESLAGAYHYMIGADDRGVTCFISSLTVVRPLARVQVTHGVLRLFLPLGL